MQAVSKGLAGVVVDQTAISDVQGEAGRLTYRGRDIAELTEQPFHQVARWVVDGELDDGLAPLLAQQANLDDRESAAVLALPAELHPMLVLQSVIPGLSPAVDWGYGEANQGLQVAAKVPAIVATHLRREIIHLDPTEDYVGRFLAAINPDGGVTASMRAAFNTAQILQLEHSFNAGTFAARVVASTLAPVQSAISAGIGALYGELHGGADEAVLNIADGLSGPKEGEDYVRRSIADGIKVPGMGHREYRVRDPRAAFMQHWAETLSRSTQYEATYETLVAIEHTFRDVMQAEGKALHANVEFYKGLVYRMLGLPNHFFTAGFAMARVFGYIAHFIESRQDNRIYRPAAQYVPPPAKGKSAPGLPT